MSFSKKTLRTLRVCRGVCKNWRDTLSPHAIQEISDGIETIECLELSQMKFETSGYLFGSRTQSICFDEIETDSQQVHESYDDEYKDEKTKLWQFEIAKLCPNLRKLSDTHCQISDQSILKFIEHCPLLSSVSIVYPLDITGASLFALARCQNLKSFEFGSFDMCSDDGLIALFHGCPNLESLKLYYIAGITNESLCEISKLRNLQTLLIDYKIDEILTEIAHGCPKLKSLHCYSSDNSLLEVIRLCPEITELGTIVTDVSLMAIADTYPNLKELIIYEGSRVSDSALHQVFQKCPKLKRLSLNESKTLPCQRATFDLQTCFEDIVKCPQLEILSLAVCRISKKFTEDISKLRCLKQLGVYNCKNFDEMSLFHIVDKCKSLKKIYTDVRNRVSHPNTSKISIISYKE